ncbi:Plastid lipid-associated protein/fibrillin conserved domain [Macleaya cordata]|uniref:Plastid lipid-associated protein/fibrillin conserved domain n=1 Tax=Macleaya cordata TaxID=56857 RepID=A0A200PZ66_MACCD|nr:Plastid lipid-associated protein/fibrillin conserved domain [Macleaya cordata]
MSGVSAHNPFLTKSLSISRPQLQFHHKNSISSINSIRIPSKNLIQSPKKFSILKQNRSSRLVFRIRAIENEEPSEPEPEKIKEEGIATAMAEEEPKEEEEVTEISNLKKALVDSLYGTDRGLRASSETRAEIIELITQLEANNPTPSPTEALTLLNGKWILAYTSFTGLFPVMARGTLPLVKVDEISQIIDSENFTVQNSVQFAGPLATTSLSTNAKFEVRSPKRVQVSVFYMNQI